MNKKRTYTIVALIIAVLALGIGYAVTSNITLTVNGNATIKSDFTFDVQYDVVGNFVTNPTGNLTDEITPAVSVTRASDTVATVTFNFDSAHREAYAIFPVINKSEDLKATFDAVPTVTQIAGDKAEYFNDVEAELYTDASCSTAYSANTEIAAKTGTVYLKVSLSLAKLPLEDVAAQSFTVSFKAYPVEAEL